MKNRIVLIGDEKSKRYYFFKKACNELNVNFVFMNYNNINLEYGDIVKIDPINITSYDISEMNNIIDNYKYVLNELNDNKYVNFLNSPKSILLCMDKYECKKSIDMNLCTYMYDEKFNDSDELFSYLTENKINSIFIKPRYGSGAAGIIALKWNYISKQAIAYTTIFNNNDKFYNTKNVYCIRDMKVIVRIVDFVISMGVVVEKWISKKRYNNLYYDIRAVIVDKKLTFVVPRGSKSPITNLHINNIALDENIIEKYYEIEEFCNKIMNYFKDMVYAGIDILISPNNKLLLIEVNSQGDAIYKDFYNDNIIYKKQIDIMRRMSYE